MTGSIYSSKVGPGESPIHGRGTFAQEPIHKGEIVFAKNGHILNRDDMYSHGVIDCYWPINDDVVYGAKTAEEVEKVKLFINHSCNPNCGLVGKGTGVAMRDIEQGEEITFDYAMLDDERYEIPCRCGSLNCRKKFTGFDWKIPELQDRYDGFFVDYLQERIDAAKRK